MNSCKKMNTLMLNILLILILVFSLMPQSESYALTPAEDIKAIIDNFEPKGAGTGKLLSAEIDNSGKVITVTSKDGNQVTEATEALLLDIPQGVTVRWAVDYSGAVNSIGGDDYKLGNLVYINGKGSFEVAKGGKLLNLGSGKCIYIEASDFTLTVSGGSIVTELNNTNAVSLWGNNNTVNIVDGTISSIWGSTLIISGDNSVVNVRGGEVIGDATEHGVIRVTKDVKGDNKVNVYGGAVKTTIKSAILGFDGTEVNIYGGNVSAGGTNIVNNGPAINSAIINIYGGIVTAASQDYGAVYATATNGTSFTMSGGVLSNSISGINAITAFNTASVNINGGLIFAKGISTSNIFTHDDLGTPSVAVNAPAVVCTWDEGAGNIEYTAGTDDDLSFYTGSAKATWGIDNTQSGIIYGSNGFFQIPGITVNRKQTTSEQLSFSLSNKTYNGKAQGINVTPKSNVGKVTAIYYNGKQVVPKEAGKYLVTVDVAEGRSFLGANNVKLGWLTIDKANISKVKVVIPDITWTGDKRSPVPVIKLDNTIINKSNFSFSYGENKKIGKGKIKITGKNNLNGTKHFSFNIVPKKVKMKKASVTKKSIKVVWTKASKNQKITGYQIYYKQKSAKSWKKKTVNSKPNSITIRNLKKGKTYQIKVRAYKTVNKAKYYGAFSTTKTTKKV